MNQSHFQVEIKRLIEVYGAKHFPEARVKLIWKCINSFTDEWLTKTVDYFIAYEQFPPMQAKWDEQIGKAREHAHQRDKERYAREAQEFVSTYSGDEIKTIVAGIIERVKGNMSEQDRISHQRMLERTSKCKQEGCEDTGAYFDKEVKGWRECSCRRRRTSIK